MTPMSKYDGAATDSKSNNTKDIPAIDNNEYDNSGAS
jgi:hypothetical protein